jgi:predicted dehydrogenase
MKLLIVGLGSIGQRHVRCLQELFGDEHEIIAYRQRGLNLEITKDLQARENVRLEDRYGVRSYYKLDDALRERPAAALVCTPNHLHMPMAIELARAGAHLFLEKPVSHSLEGVETLQRLIEENNLACCVGYQLRFHPGIQRLARLLREDALGEIFSAHFDFGEHMPFWHRYEDYSQTFMAKKSQGGGVTLTQIHDIDIIYSLFGMPDAVYASGGNTGLLEMDAEDHASSLLKYPANGRSFAVTLTHDCLRYPPRRSYVVHGTGGSLLFDCYRNLLQFVPFNSEAQTIYEDKGLERNALFCAQMRHFIACVRREETPIVGLHEAVQSLRIALAIKESLKCSREIVLATRKF